MNYPKSDDLYARAQRIMHPVTQTLAKGPGQYTKGASPKYVKRGQGAHVWDVDGNEYIDYQMGIGPLSLGYAYPRVDEAIKAQLEDGITFSMMHELEVQLAELVREVIPNAESIRISKTGADVTSAAVRVARAFTGREQVLCCGYHGWHDWYIGTTSRDKGIPQATEALTTAFEYNNLEGFKALLTPEVACVILEPFIYDAPKDNFLHEVARLCKENGTLLIFDETWTGFRVALGGAQEYFGIKADLATFSRACANGMPIALLTGRADVMRLFEQDVFFFTTFGGEALSMAAAMATIQELRDQNVPARLAEQGKKLKDGYNQLAADLGLSDYTKCYGYDCRTLVTFDPKGGNPLEIKAYVQQELFKRGIMWSASHNMSFSHTDEDIAQTLAAYKEVLALLKDAIDQQDVARRLEGEPVEAVFRKVTNAAPVKAK